MKKIGIIGCGVRTDCYVNELRKELGTEWEIAAFADPDSTAIDIYMKEYQAEKARRFISGPELIREMAGTLDAVIIGSPNRFHLESLLPALEQNLTILLEKPVVIHLADCAEAWKAYENAGQPRVAVGFVLRYTDFYRKVFAIVDDGRIGKILSITATESISPAISSVFARQWRRFEASAGPLILEKCSHDLDIINALAHSTARKVASFAARTKFVPKPEAAMFCRDCSLRSDCRYEAGRIEIVLHGGGVTHTGEEDDSHYRNIARHVYSDNDLCVFNSEKDVPDHQVVQIEYENGILATFTVTLDQPNPTRTIQIWGTNGYLFGDIESEELYVKNRIHEGTDDGHGRSVKEVIPIVHDHSGHHGGDSVISEQFKSMMRGDSSSPPAGLKEGIDACIISMAAEKSRKENCVVEVGPYYDEIYGRDALR